ncbi:MAG: response regulator [Thermoleophilia bacterium]|nr:response regulator [Thermoleophilia bacterium]
MARVLIVDDSAFSRKILRSIIEPEGHEVIEASDGMSAIEQYYLHKPQVVFLDLIMSGMRGIEVLSRLRELDPSARIIIATADIQKSSVQVTREAGAAGFVTKPFQRESVLRALHDQLGEAAQPEVSR